MARRNVDLTSLSFLDVLTSALGAVIFLFIVVPKLPDSPNPTSPQVQLNESSTVSADSLSMSNSMHYPLQKEALVANLSSALFYTRSGNPMTLLINDNPMAAVNYSFSQSALNQSGNYFTKSRPYQAPFAYQKGQNVPNVTSAFNKQGKDTILKKTNETAIPFLTVSNNQKAEQILPSIAQQPQKPLKINPDLTENMEKGERNIRRPSNPCRVAFEINWDNAANNVDLFVFKGEQFVCGRNGNRSNPTIGDWDSGKSRNRIFNNDLRTTQEAVRQFNTIIAGEYRIFAQFKETTKPDSISTVKLNGLIYTKNENGVEKSSTFNTMVSLNPKVKQVIGSVTINPDGTFVFNKL